MKFALVFFIALIATRSNDVEANLDQAYLRKVFSARKSSEVRRYQQERNSILVARLACKIQLNQELIPSACYKSLSLETEFDRSRRPSSELLDRLDEVCRVAALKGRLPKTLEGLTTPCLRAARRAQELYNYRRTHHLGAKFEQ